MYKKTVLQNLTLETKESTENAISEVKKALELFDSDWFEGIELVNNSSFNINLCLFQGLDQVPPIPSGYVANTGVTVGGVNLPAGGHVYTHVEASIKCQATRVKCSAEIETSQGAQRVDWDDAVVDDPSEYIVSVVFTLNNANAVASGFSTSIEVKTSKKL